MAQHGICLIAGCGKPHVARGWCGKHWRRWRKWGDPLVVKPRSIGAAQQWLRDVAVPYGGDDCLVWPFSRNSEGYGNVSFQGKTAGAHRVICWTVYGAPPTPAHEAAHSCGKGREGCVNPRHLRWATHSENMQDSIRHGTFTRGEKNSRARVTKEDIGVMRTLRKAGLTYPAIAEHFDVSSVQVGRILTGTRWRWYDAEEVRSA